MAQKSSSVSYPPKKVVAREPICAVCGKLSQQTICHACADKVQAEAVSKKKRENKGEE
jgi:recombinational DNA repair protein RecR